MGQRINKFLNRLIDGYSNRAKQIYILSVIITIFLIGVLVWNLFYSYNNIKSFNDKELAIENASGDLLFYTKSLEMSTRMCAETGDLIWEKRYRNIKPKLENVLQEIPELVDSKEIIQVTENIKDYRSNISRLEEQAFNLIGNGEKREAVALLAGWEYTKNQRKLSEATNNLAGLLEEHIQSKIAFKKKLTSVILAIVLVCLAVLILSWIVTVGVWRINTRKQREKEERIKYLSYHDALTGLYNRRYFEEEMHRMDSNHYIPVGMIMIDIDGLKIINDSFGHETGDEHLKVVAKIIRENIREDDVLARISGDEFAVILPHSNHQNVKSIAERIENAARKYNINNPNFPVSFSIGFALKEDDLKDMDSLFREADNNMYRRKLHNLRSSESDIVQALTKTLEARDFITEGHADRLQELVVNMGEELELPEHRLADLRLLAQFHDLGKVGVPDSILFKSGSLNWEERQEIQRHPEIGYRIANSSQKLASIADYILKHHERWDGNGYPLGLKEKEIPLECRILAIADAYDAMTSDRPYRKAMSHEEAVAELERCSGEQFDPELVSIFLSSIKEFDKNKLV